MENGSTPIVEALARGLDVIQAFDRDHPEMTLSEVAGRVGVSPATARRSLLTLQALGFVVAHDRKFLLTPRVLRLSEAFLSSMNLQKVAQQYLQSIVDLTQDSSSMAVLDGTDVVYVASVSVRRPIRLTAGVGTRYPAYATSLGRVLLAHLDETELEETLNASKLIKLTERTETDPDRLRQIFREVRQTGVAGIEDELDYGVVSVAVPVRGSDGHVVAAVNCSTSPSRTRLADMLVERRSVLEQAREQIEQALSAYPWLLRSVAPSTATGA